MHAARSKRSPIDTKPTPTKPETMSPTDIRRVLSQSSPQPTSSINHCEYIVSKSTTSKRGALVDRGANGGLSGIDTRTIATTDRKVSVTSIIMRL